MDKTVKQLRSLARARNTILLHAAACARGSKGYLFLGPSDSGKTTVTKLSGSYSVMSDEGVLLKRVGNRFKLFQTPILYFSPGKPGEKTKMCVFLDKIFLLKQSKSVEFKGLSRARAMASLIESGKDLNRLFKQDIKKIFEMSYSIARTIPAFEMGFRKDRSFWKYIRKL